jgi:hypothetical protein
MTNDLETLARRAVACKHWRWMPGMRVATEMGDAFRVEDIDFCFGELNWPKPHALLLPDLTDPATLGCLFALVREAWKTADLAAIRSAFKDGSVVLSIPMTAAFKEAVLTGECIGGPTEAEALVAALEGAP